MHYCNSFGSAPLVRCGKTRNRYVNASNNILILLMTRVTGQERLTAFCVPDCKKTQLPDREATEMLRPVDPPPVGSIGHTRLLSYVHQLKC